MRAFLAAAIAAIEAAAVALATLLFTAAVAVALWWLSFGLAAEPRDVFAAAGGVWLLAHFSPLEVALTADTMRDLGFGADPLTFTLSLAPLGLTAVTGAFGARAGWRFGTRGGTGAGGVAGGFLGFGTVATVVAMFAPQTALPPIVAGIVAGLVFAVPSGLAYVIRSAREQHAWWEATLDGVERTLGRVGLPKPGRFRGRAGAVLRLWAMFVAGYVGVAALALAVTFVVRYAQVIAGSQALQLDVWGAIAMFVLQLLLLPIAVIWSGAWLSGAGFAVGVGSSASPFGALLGPLPGFPLLAAIPDGWGAFAVLAPVLVALLGVGVGVVVGSRARTRSLAELLITVLVAALLFALTVALLGWLASGSLGPGRLELVGPRIWLTALLAAIELGVGALLGVLAGRADIARRVATAGDSVRDRFGALTESRSEVTSVREPIAVLRPETDRFAEQLTEPLAYVAAEFSAARGDEDSTEHATEPLADLPLADLPLADLPLADLPLADPPMSPARAPRPTRLFDQHGDGSTAARNTVAPDSAATNTAATDTAAPDTAAPGVTPETSEEALIEAYSWDHFDDEPPAEPEQPGWRWPRRKG